MIDKDDFTRREFLRCLLALPAAGVALTLNGCGAEITAPAATAMASPAAPAQATSAPTNTPAAATATATAAPTSTPTAASGNCHRATCRHKRVHSIYDQKHQRDRADEDLRSPWS